MSCRQQGGGGKYEQKQGDGNIHDWIWWYDVNDKIHLNSSYCPFKQLQPRGYLYHTIPDFYYRSKKKKKQEANTFHIAFLKAILLLLLKYFFETVIYFLCHYICNIPQFQLVRCMLLRERAQKGNGYMSVCCPATKIWRSLLLTG